MLKLKQIILLLSLLCNIQLYAARSVLYTSDKLSSSQINTICQDEYGYIWVGTEYGLNRFDGYHFTNYLHKDDDAATIKDNVVSCLFCDKEGNLWIGCKNGLSQFDYTSGKFHSVAFDENISPRVNSMVGHGDDILIGTAGYGLYRYDKKVGQVNAVLCKTQIAQPDFFSRIHVDDKGRLWKADHTNTFAVMTYKNGSITDATSFKSPYGAPVSFINGKNYLIIVCMNGILRYHYDDNKMEEGIYDTSELSGSGNVTIRRATADSQGNIYIGTQGKGVMMIPRGETVMKRYICDGSFDLASANVKYLMTDRDGNLWMGCFRKGLLLSINKHDGFAYWDINLQNVNTGSCISSLVEGDNGCTFCTVENNGVYKLDAKGNVIQHLAAPFDVKRLYRDKKGEYWACTEHTLYSYNPNNGSSVKKAVFDGWGLNCITSDNKGLLYISNYGKGLVIYDTSTGNIREYTMGEVEDKDTLHNNWILSLETDAQGLLWIGTSDGLECLNTNTMKFISLGKNKPLKYHQCLSLKATSDGNIIVGTDKGAFIYKHTSAGENTIESLSNLLTDKIIGDIIVDNAKNFWFGTSNGIWYYDAATGNTHGYMSGDGLKTKEYIEGTAVCYSDGRIGFGSSDGITTFYPSEVTKQGSKPGKLFLTRFETLGRQSMIGDYFDIPYDENTFTMDFSLLDYSNTTNVAIQYRMDGSNWITAPEGQNSLTFNNMRAGKHNIEVRAYSNGQAAEETTVITVMVEQPWYWSTLAKFLYLLAAIGIIALLWQFVNRKRIMQLEEDKMKFLINATHDIRSPLTLIVGPLRKLRQRATNEEDKADLDAIDHNAQRLLQLVNQILDERKIDKQQLKLKCRSTNLVTFIEGIVNLYRYNAKERDINLIFEHEEQKVTAWIDRVNFDKVMSNLLSNSFKYTFGGGEIKVKLATVDNQAVIEIIDSGIGLGEENTDKIFDRFYQGRSADMLRVAGSGIGLNLCKTVVEMHKGHIKAANRTDGVKGSVFTITLPLGNEHLEKEEIAEDNNFTEVSKNDTSKLRILVVDDDHEIGHYISNELSEWYKFDYSPNGKEALKNLLSVKYDLVITDIMMPEMDGIELLRNIKGNPNISDIPVVLLTSKAEVSNRLEGLKKGANAFIAKPFNIDELHVVIDNLIGNVRRLKGKYSGAQEQKEKLKETKVTGNNEALMQRVMDSINKHLSDPEYNIEVMTGEVGLSRAQLHRKMKEMTGMSTADFIRNIRMKEAARLLKENKINVTQVAYEVGFNNQGHFSTVFKKYYGVTPSEYIAKTTEEIN